MFGEPVALLSQQLCKHQGPLHCRGGLELLQGFCLRVSACPHPGCTVPCVQGQRFIPCHREEKKIKECKVASQLFARRVQEASQSTQQVAERRRVCFTGTVSSEDLVSGIIAVGEKAPSPEPVPGLLCAFAVK